MAGGGRRDGDPRACAVARRRRRVDRYFGDAGAGSTTPTGTRLRYLGDRLHPATARWAVDGPGRHARLRTGRDLARLKEPCEGTPGSHPRAVAVEPHVGAGEPSAPI